MCQRARRGITKAIDVVLPQRVAVVVANGVGGTSLEIHEHLVFGDAACHQLTITAEDIATSGFHAHRVTLQTGGYLCPVQFYTVR